MNPEEFKNYLEQMVKLTRSQLDALKTVCEKEIATKDLVQYTLREAHQVSRGAW